MKTESSLQPQQQVFPVEPGQAGDDTLPTVPRATGAQGRNFGLQDDASMAEMTDRLITKAKKKMKEAVRLESKLPFYTGLAYDASLYDVVGTSNHLMALSEATKLKSHKYIFVFHKQDSESQAETAEIHEEDLSRFSTEYVTNGDLFRHLYPRRPVLLEGSWTAVTVFEQKDHEGDLAELLRDKVAFAQAADLQATLDAYQKNAKYSKVYNGSRQDVHSLIQGSLAREIEQAHGRAGKLVGSICAGVIFAAAFGAPAVYLAYHAAMGLASNFGGEVAGAVILGVIALFIITVLGANSRKHACYTQVGNRQHLRSHLGQTVFDISEGEEPTQAPAVQATVIES